MNTTGTDSKLREALGEAAKKLVEGMRHRVNRDPDVADYAAAFEPILEQADSLSQQDIADLKRLLALARGPGGALWRRTSFLNPREVAEVAYAAGRSVSGGQPADLQNQVAPKGIVPKDAIWISKDHFNKLCQFAAKHKYGRCDCYDGAAPAAQKELGEKAHEE